MNKANANSEEYFEAEVVSIGETVRLKGNGKEFEVSGHQLSTSQAGQFEPGDKVIVLTAATPEGVNYSIVDLVRRDALAVLFIFFVVLALIIGRKWGLASLLGMAYSFLIIFVYLLPRIISGADPVFNAVVGAALIVPVTFYLSHGIAPKTHIAIVSTIITLAATAILAAIFIEAVRLTGFAAEEAIFLQNMGNFNMKGILLAGIIIGVLGILDDITISQASVVEELRAVSPKSSPAELYKRAMNVGRDHIASLINTLVLVYTGASLPLLLLFTESGRPFGEVINIEMIADEIVRTLVGSIGLILAVPLTTFIAAFLVTKEK